MPNWCSNYIVISGDVDKISLLKNILEDVPKTNVDDCIVFTTLVGKEPTITTEEYEKGGWFNSNVDWFGTKWDVSYSDCQFEFNDDNIIMMPMTAWSPPVRFVSNLCKMYGVTAVMDYDEGGCDFCGKAIIDIDGEVDEEDYGYNSVSDLSGIISDSVDYKEMKKKGSYVYYTYEFNLNNTTKLITERCAYISDGSESHSQEVNFVEYIKD